jgi:hypothetical protein
MTSPKFGWDKPSCSSYEKRLPPWVILTARNANFPNKQEIFTKRNKFTIMVNYCVLCKIFAAKDDPRIIFRYVKDSNLVYICFSKRKVEIVFIILGRLELKWRYKRGKLAFHKALSALKIILNKEY